MSRKHTKHATPRRPEPDDPTPDQAEPAPPPVEPVGSDADADTGPDQPIRLAVEADTADVETLRERAAERDEYLDMLQRVKAEYSNYQKRVLRDQQELRKFASQDLVGDLLPVLDNLDRALEAGVNASEAKDLTAGVEMVRTQMVQALARHGVEALDCTGLPFDPNFHEAVMQQPSADHPPGTVMTEVERGYTYNGRVLRPAKVVVSAAPPEPAAPPATEA